MKKMTLTWRTRVLFVFVLSFLGAALAGPRVTIIGDSYSTYVGTMPSGYATYYNGIKNDVTSVEHQYWKRVINMLGGTLEVNNAWSGSWLSLKHGGQSSMISDTRLAQLGDPDLILICAGTNDSWSGSDNDIGSPVYHDFLSDYTTAEKEKTSPALCYLIKWLQTYKPNAEIMIVINSYDDGTDLGIKKRICDDQAAIAQHYGVMHVQCHDIHKQNRHPDTEGFYTMSEQILEVYYAAHRDEMIVSETEYSQYATSDDPTMRVVRMTKQGLAYVFTSTNGVKTLTAHTDIVIKRALVVGGGGAGGWTIGGGGGGGQVKDLTSEHLPNNGEIVTNETLSISVASGGLNQFSAKYSSANGADGCRACRGGNGGSSTVVFPAGKVTALGGGGGGSYMNVDGVAAGNGGGGASREGVQGFGGVGSDGGFNGGDSYLHSDDTSSIYAPGGGGGANGFGDDGYRLDDAIASAGAGGAAVASEILGYTEYFGGGGGGGGGNNAVCALGAANAGNGADSTSAYVCGRPGRNGFGGGGGGGGYHAAKHIDTSGGNGGSGTVILLVDYSSRNFTPKIVSSVSAIGATSATVTLELSTLGQGATSADVYFGYAVSGSPMPELKKIASGVSCGNVVTTLAPIRSDATYDYWYAVTNNLSYGSRTHSGFFKTKSILPGEHVALSDSMLVASSVAEAHATADGFVYVFKQPGTFKFAFREDVEIVRALLVGGGGSGGWTIGGGGGGGGVSEVKPGFDLKGEAIVTFTVGNGGPREMYDSSTTTADWVAGTAGGASTLTLGGTVYTAAGGGYGGGWNSPSGGAGANGGGASATGSATVSIPGGIGATGGYDGGANCQLWSSYNSHVYNTGGGGGGAGGSGECGTCGCPGNGGDGIYCDITGVLECYGSGGGAGCGNNSTIPGFGGMNAGDGASIDAVTNNFHDINGTAGFGGGGGGGSYLQSAARGYAGGAGGAGTVIVVAKPRTGAKPVATVAITETEANATRFKVAVTDFGAGATSAKVYLAYGMHGSPLSTETIYRRERISDLDAGTVYDYRVRIVNDLGVERLIEGSFKTLPYIPPFQAVFSDEMLAADQPLVRTETGNGYTYVFADPTKTGRVFFRQTMSIDGALIIGGGGAGGTTIGGGGGGGQVVVRSADDGLVVRAGSSARMRPGKGGVVTPAPSGGNSRRQPGLNGESSYLKLDGHPMIVAIGGGGGGSYGSDSGSAETHWSGRSGANGGGGAHTSTGGVSTIGGHKGGDGWPAVGQSYKNWGPGGGGGANGDGKNGHAIAAGDGGAGILSSITGTPLDYGSGGGGGCGNFVTTRGEAGGAGAGAGGTTTAIAGGAGYDGRGGGGGGGGYGTDEGAGGIGGSGGIVFALSPLDTATPRVSVDRRTISDTYVHYAVSLMRLGDFATSAEIAYRYRIASETFEDWTTLTDSASLGWQGTIVIPSLEQSTAYVLEVKAINDLGVEKIVTRSFTTVSLTPPFSPTYTDKLIATSVDTSDFDIYRVDGSRTYVFRNTTLGKVFTLATMRLQSALLVGGGGAGGTTIGGGGGGGAVKEIDVSAIALCDPATLATFTIGAGGTTSPSWNTPGGCGQATSLTFADTQFSAAGGGGGGSWNAGPQNGASGGGGSQGTTGALASFGHLGGNSFKGIDKYDYCPGGGGGASEDGEDGMTVSQRAGKGGEGRVSSITGTAVTYGSGGGGGGGNGVYHAPGGTNGGEGGKNTGSNGTAGVDGTGSGGGGGGYNNRDYAGGAGGSGTVILRFADPNLAQATIDATQYGLDELSISIQLDAIGVDAQYADVYLAYGPVGGIGEYRQLKSAFTPGEHIVYNIAGLAGMDEVAFWVKFIDNCETDTFFKRVFTMSSEPTLQPANHQGAGIVRVAETNALSAKLAIRLIDAGSPANAVSVALAVAKHGEEMGEPIVIAASLGLREEIQRTLQDLESATQYDYLVRMVSTDNAAVTNDIHGSITTPTVSVLAADEPTVDNQAKTITFSGSLSSRGTGETILKLLYGSTSESDEHELTLGAWHDGDVDLSFASDPIPCGAASNPMPVVHYRYVLIQRVDGREIYRSYTSPCKCRVYNGLIFFVR